MNLTEKFLAFALLGAEWVMWVLVFLSVISVGIMIERIIYFLQRRMDLELLTRDVKVMLGRGEHEQLVRRYQDNPSIEAQVAVAGVREIPRGADAVSEAMLTAKTKNRHQLDRNLAFLGTLGNNAPFIGLFGTVLGIIKAFNDLAKNSQAGAEAVMAGISEALVATAIGLLVAIPAVLAFNFFQRLVKRSISQSDAVAHVILGEVRAEDVPAKKGAA